MSWPDFAPGRYGGMRYIETFYNRCRRHPSLGYPGPVAYEQLFHQQELAPA